jgi:hypothetical protein
MVAFLAFDGVAGVCHLAGWHSGSTDSGVTVGDEQPSHPHPNPEDQFRRCTETSTAEEKLQLRSRKSETTAHVPPDTTRRAFAG